MSRNRENGRCPNCSGPSLHFGLQSPKFYPATPEIGEHLPIFRPAFFITKHPSQDVDSSTNATLCGWLCPDEDQVGMFDL